MKRQADPASRPAKVSLNLRMDEDVVHSLKLYGLHTGRYPSDIVAGLIEAHIPSLKTVAKKGAKS
jgi:hypothetical protein